MLFLAAFFLTTGISSGQLLTWDASSNGGGPSGFGISPWAPATINQNITTSGLIRGGSIQTGGSAASGAWGGSGGWAANGATSDNNSFHFTVVANSGYNVSLSSITTATRRSGSGPAGHTLYYSVNGGAFTSAGTVQTTSASGTTGTSNSISLSGVAALQSVPPGTVIKFRINPINPDGSGGTYYLTGNVNALRVNGTVSPAASIGTVSPTSLTNFGNIAVNSFSASQTFTVGNGSGITGNITATAPANFQVSTNNTDFSGSVNFANPSSGQQQTVYARFSPTSAGVKTGNITISASGATNKTVSVSGTAGTAPVINSTLTAGSEYGSEGTYAITATGTSVTYNAEIDELPPGASFAGSTITFNPAFPAGEYEITITASNIFGSDSETVVYTRTAKALLLSGGSAENKIYDGTATATLSAMPILNGVTEGDDVSLSGTPEAFFTDTFAGTDKVVNITGGYSFTGTDAGNYSLALPQQPEGLTADITTKELTINGITINDKDYDATTAATISGTPVLSGIVEGDDVTLNVSSVVAEFTMIEPGTDIPVTVTGYSIEGADAPNYTLTQPQGLTANINETGLQDQTITFNALDEVTYGDAPFELTATASSGLAVSYESSDPDIAVITGNTLTITGLGTVTVTALQEGNGAYNPALMVTQDLVVNQKQLTVINNVVTDKTYNGTTSAEISGTLSGVVGDDEVTLSDTGEFASADAGNDIGVTTNYAISGDDAAKYTIVQPEDVTGNILPAELTLINATANDKEYDALNTAVITGTLSGVIGDDEVALNGSGTFASVDAAENIDVNSTSTLSGADDDNYILLQPTGLTATITPKELTVTATAQDKEYDRSTDAVITDVQLTGVIEGDDVTASGNGVFDNFNAGTDKTVTTTLVLGGNDAANYTLVQATALADITPKPITVDITGATAEDKTYDGTTIAVVSGAVFSGVIEGDEENAVANAGTFAQTNVGQDIEVSIALTGTASANYTVTQPDELLSATITQAPLTATADDATKAQGEANPVFTITYNGLVNGETTLTAEGFVAPTATTVADETSPEGAYPIVLTGGDALNYSFTSLTNGTLFIGGGAGTPVTIWENDINDGNPSNYNPFTLGQVVAGNITVSGIGRSNGLDANGGSNRYNAKGWNSGSLSSNLYYYFTITPQAGYSVNLNSFVFTGTASGTGPTNYAIRTSIDNYASSISSPDLSGFVTDLSGDEFQNISEPITVRIYAWGASSAAGTFSVNDFYFTGSVTEQPALPEITSSLVAESTEGETDSYQITTEGTPLITFSAQNLPEGATINETGLLSFDGTTPAGVYNISITAQSYYGSDTETLVYTVTAAPSITAMPEEISLTAVQGQGASAPVQMESLMAVNLIPASGNITVTASAGFQVSINAGAYGQTASFAYTGSTINNENPEIYVRLASGQAVGTYTGTLTFSGGGASSEIILNGEVEIAPAIRTIASDFGPYCQGTTNAVSVAFTTEGTFNNGTFYLQYSDASGVFPNNFTNILLASPAASSPISATLPALPAGNYRVRIIHLSDDTVLTVSTDDTEGTGADNNSNIVINALPQVAAVTTETVCSNENAIISLTGLLPNAELSVDYTVNGGAAQQAVDVVSDENGEATFEIAVTASNDGQQITVTGLTRTDVSGSCAATFNASAILSVQPLPTIATAMAAETCEGEEVIVSLTGLTANSTSTITYTINNGDITTAENVVADGDGNGSFTFTAALDTDGTELAITSITDNTTSCTAEISGVTTTVSVTAKPAAILSSDNTSVCLGESTAISIAFTGAQPWTVTYTDGTDEVTVNAITASPYVFEVTPSESVTYTITAVSDANCSTEPELAQLAISVSQNTWTGTESIDWHDAANWSCGIVPTADTPATIAGADNSPEISNTTAYAASLTVEDDAMLTIAEGNNIIVSDFINVAPTAVMVVEHTANILQVNDVANEGEVTIYRNSSPLYNLDYTIWSSPTSGNQTLKAFSPETLDARFYVYNTELNAYSNYNSASGIFGGSPDEVAFVPAKGYLIRMPDGLPQGETSVFEGAFTGTPNNGNVTILLSTLGNRYNAVGNPYPSPINIWQFIDDNESSLDNGTLYFWRKTNNPAATTYATITKAAYVANDIDGADGGNTSGDYYIEDTEDEWVINPGQGFFVKAAETASQLVFNNTMRRAVNNNQFFRTQESEEVVMSRLWLNITNTVGGFGQTAIAYSNVTTQGLDYGWDGLLLNDGEIAIYTFAEDKKLSIQARQEFSNDDTVALGYKATVPGTLSINLDHYGGVFTQEDVQVYLIDHVAGITHNIKAGAYSFTTDAGSFDDRFEVVYVNSTLGSNHPDTASAIGIYQQDKNIYINSSKDVLKSLKVYDIRGREIYNRKNINTLETVISDLTAEQQVLILEIITVNGILVTKKIIY